MVELCSNLSDERIVIVNRLYDLSKHDKYIFVDQKGAMDQSYSIGWLLKMPCARTFQPALARYRPFR